jgi:hypothetical protein
VGLHRQPQVVLGDMPYDDATVCGDDRGRQGGLDSKSHIRAIRTAAVHRFTRAPPAAGTVGTIVPDHHRRADPPRSRSESPTLARASNATAQVYPDINCWYDADVGHGLYARSHQPSKVGNFMKRGMISVAAATVAMLTAVVFGAAAPAQAAPTYEWNTAAAASYTSAIQDMPCVSLTGAQACWQQNGDDMWVYDSEPDGNSATFSWYNYNKAGTLVRQGSCVNKRGAYNWGKCNKDFAEGTSIEFFACNYRQSTGDWYGCSKAKWTTA